MNTFPSFILYALSDMRIINGELHARPEFDPATHALIDCAEYASGDKWRDLPAVYRTPERVQIPGEPVLVSPAIIIDGKEVAPARYETPMVWHQPDPVLVSPASREQIASGGVAEYQRRAAAWRKSQPAPPAPEPVPQEVTNRAFRLALRAVTGIRPSAVTTALQTIPDDDQREDTLSEWEYANTISRSNALLPLMAARFGVTAEQIDTVFREAAKL